MKHNINIDKIPKEVLSVVAKLSENGYEAWIVGGSVRDLMLGLEPKDWDVTTNAIPEEIVKTFPRTYYENSFGTVGVVSYETDEELNILDESLRIIEVTTYRSEGDYKDGRHPEKVNFVKNIEEDLKRRDFTINSLAYDPIKDILKDNHDGIKDIEDKKIRAVGVASERFMEDKLRMLRAARIANQLGFSIEKETESAIIELSNELKTVSRERIRDEFSKIIMSETPMIGILLLDHLNLLKDIIPELTLGKGVKQTANHKYDVYGHLLRSLQHSADKGYSLDLRLATLLHDIAKPHTARFNKSTGYNTFHGHEVVGERVSREILNRLKYPEILVSRVTKLVRWHMFNSDPDKVTMSAVRRMIVNVGRENIWDLMNIRLCDRIGSGRPLEEPHRLRRYYAMIEEALTQPTDLKMLKIDGKTIMNVTHETPGPKIGLLLNAVFGEVLENPSLNTEEELVSRVTELNKLSLAQLKKMKEDTEHVLHEIDTENKKTLKKKFKI